MPPVPELDVVGIGNALVDVIAHVAEVFIDAQDLTKGAMTLIDTERAMELYAAMGSGVEMSGGSAANTMCGIASFGGQAAYIGKVADDPLGDVFGHDLRAVGVHCTSAKSVLGVPTGRCLIVVTPDGQRTMNTYLGVSSLFGPDDVDDDLVTSGKVLYMEGYLWDRPEAKEAYRKAARLAHGAGAKVALTLSDSFCVDRHRDDFYKLVEDEVDILFANEHELAALYQVDDFDDAVAAVREHCEIAAVTLGKAGSLVVTEGDVVAIDASPVNVLDTTGAGDLYAAGFLYGLTHDHPLGECGHLGSLAAAEVISHVGARPLASLRRLAGLV